LGVGSRVGYLFCGGRWGEGVGKRRCGLGGLCLLGGGGGTESRFTAIQRTEEKSQGVRNGGRETLGRPSKGTAAQMKAEEK